MYFFNEIDNKKTPVEKVNCFEKGYNILQNSIRFCSGKEVLGVDDTLQILIYTILKSKLRFAFSNYNYSQLYINSELGKRQYGVLLSQFGMVLNIISEMKEENYTDNTK